MNALVLRPESLAADAVTAGNGSTAAARHALAGAALRAHPDFPAVRDAAVANLVQLFRGDYLLGRLLLEEGRYITIQTILSLAACQQAEERSSWLTLGRLQTRLAGSELASRNRIEALVAILERYGYLERRKAEEDMRITLLLPTARLWGADAVLMEALAGPVARFGDAVPQGSAHRGLLARARQAGQPHTEDAGLAAEAAPAAFDPQTPAWSSRDLAIAGAGHRSWHRAVAPELDAYFALRARHAELQGIASRDGGYLTLLLLLLEAGHSASAHVSLPFELLSSHTGVSRTHARLLIEQAEACGFIRLHARGGRDIEVCDRLHEAMDTWFADLMAFILAVD
ncbi:hypothetical protein [Pannonibacter tanglangensis]|uniref:MarR family transcriptional regulator n=1 Tax=Pannonibacter tanglangensis TaxID=2750084 RepID=A0ABW9ZME3_9HYPH|nr:hypothetical protein [Pannonibacter sp. XCT-34]NBN65077.1 hypothetical protein [Pannonibacter sp. XCT-34]